MPHSVLGQLSTKVGYRPQTHQYIRTEKQYTVGFRILLQIILEPGHGEQCKSVC